MKSLNNFFEIVISFFSLIWLAACSSIPEPTYVTKDPVFSQKYTEKVLPFIKSHAQIGTFKSFDQTELHYQYILHPSKQKVIAIAPGYTETYHEYDETMYDLYQLGFSVYVLDHRGQGNSPHLTPDPFVIHIDTFSQYTQDWNEFINQVIKLSAHTQYFLLSHSTGGLIIARYLQLYPNEQTFFNKAIFLAPLFALKLGTGAFFHFLDKLDIFDPLALFVLNWQCSEDDKACWQKTAPGQTRTTNIQEYKVKQSKGSHISSHYPRLLKNLDYFEQYPSVQTYKASRNWVKEIILSTQELKRQASDIHVPFIIVTAGLDALVSPRSQELICNLANSCHQVAILPTSRHETLNETDDIRDDVFKLIKGFF